VRNRPGGGGAAAAGGRAPVVGLVCSAAGGVEEVRTAFVEPALARGWRVPVTLTPTAARWLRASGEAARLETLTGLPVRSESRLPGEPRPHPDPDCWVAYATADLVAHLALGLSPNQALTQLNDALGTTPLVLLPRFTGRHPAWPTHLATLRTAGVHLVTSWAEAITATEAALGR
jgi:hypothetical protein